MNKNEFNKQFDDLKISIKALNFVEEDFLRNRSEELNGKPTTFLKEALRKFFTNPWLIAAFSVFMVIILLALIVPVASVYSFRVNVGQQILGGNHPPTQLIGRDLIFLPPRFPGIASGIEVRNVSVEQYHKLLKMGLIIGKPLHTPFTDGWPSATYQVKIDWYKSVAGNPLASHSFILGTTDVGSDRWTDLWTSARASLALAFAATTIQFTFGVILGAFSGYYAGKAFDTVLQRVVDLIAGLPVLIWYMIIVGMFKHPGFLALLTAFTITGWIGPTYITRMYVIKYKDAEFIKAADTYGASLPRKIFMHVLPNVTGRVGASYVQRIPYIIYAEASMAILGIGINYNSPGIGVMIRNAKGTFLTHPIDLNSPIILMIFLVLSLQIIAIGLRDILDPKISAGA